MSTLPDLLKLLAKGKASVLLLIKNKGNQEGRIYLDKGKVFHSENNKAKGEKALYRIFRWSVCHGMRRIHFADG